MGLKYKSCCTAKVNSLKDPRGKGNDILKLKPEKCSGSKNITAECIHNVNGDKQLVRKLNVRVARVSKRKQQQQHAVQKQFKEII